MFKGILSDPGFIDNIVKTSQRGELSVLHSLIQKLFFKISQKFIHQSVDRNIWDCVTVNQEVVATQT